LLLTIKNVFSILLLMIFFIPLETFVSFGQASVNRYLTLALLFGLFVELFVKRKPINFQKPIIGMILWTFWAILSYLWAPNFHRVIENTFGSISVLILFVATSFLVDKKSRLYWALLALILGQITYVIGWFMTGEFRSDGFFLPTANLGNISDHGTNIGFVITSLLAIILYGQRYRLPALIALIPGSYLFFATALRRNVMALPIVLIGLVIFSKKVTWKTYITLLFLVIGSIYITNAILPSLSSTLQNRFTVNDVIDSGGSGRVLIFSTALKVWSRSPIVGAGLGSFHFYSGLYTNTPTVPHNAFLEVLVETGLIGFMLWAGSFFTVLWKTLKTFNRAKSFPDQLLSALPLALLIYVSVSGLVTGYMGFRWLWISLGLGVASSNVFSSNDPNTNCKGLSD
jgi:O-antigen ligase